LIHAKILAILRDRRMNMKHQPIRMRPSTLRPNEDTSVPVGSLTGVVTEQLYSKVLKSGEVVRAGTRDELAQKLSAMDHEQMAKGPGVNTPAEEKLWDRAKEEAGDGKNWALVNHIYQQMRGKK
jgi:hypothetical protein